ncbi:hypothetical protein E2562_009754 [Oryza meyeriana var. granulata]|uniref:Uncharacterized protein n=1 Tax=Oryza meyeriana var. granulata TaxID=110450 RepID=A0A6G1D3V1_9ORYZ|nr:hypothetical protein E2562_009754 [Oryza meyeriana var. granulata]
MSQGAAGFASYRRGLSLQLGPHAVACWARGLYMDGENGAVDRSLCSVSVHLSFLATTALRLLCSSWALKP